MGSEPTPPHSSDKVNFVRDRDRSYGNGPTSIIRRQLRDTRQRMMWNGLFITTAPFVIIFLVHHLSNPPGSETGKGAGWESFGPWFERVQAEAADAPGLEISALAAGIVSTLAIAVALTTSNKRTAASMIALGDIITAVSFAGGGALVLLSVLQFTPTTQGVIKSLPPFVIAVLLCALAACVPILPQALEHAIQDAESRIERLNHELARWHCRAPQMERFFLRRAWRKPWVYDMTAGATALLMCSIGYAADAALGIWLPSGQALRTVAVCISVGVIAALLGPLVRRGWAEGKAGYATGWVVTPTLMSASALVVWSLAAWAVESSEPSWGMVALVPAALCTLLPWLTWRSTVPGARAAVRLLERTRKTEKANLSSLEEKLAELHESHPSLGE